MENKYSIRTSQNGGNHLAYKNVDSEAMKGSDQFLTTNNTKKSNKEIIVGFDPGLTVGIAIIDLKGNLISIASFKEIRRSEIINHIMDHGNTVLIATDVYPPPKTVRKLASNLNSKIWSPYRNMSVESKIDIVDSYMQSIQNNSTANPQNAHERDALAAAVKTYKDHLNKFRQIEKRAEKLELPPQSVDNIKKMVINGISISNALEEEFEKIKLDSTKKGKNTTRKSENNKGEEDQKIPIGFDRGKSQKLELEDSVARMKNKINSQKKHINNLLEKNRILEDENSEYRANISKLQSKIDKLHHEYKEKILEKREFATKVKTIKRLQEKYSNEKSKRLELEEKIKSNKDIQAIELNESAVPVKIIDSFTKEGIKKAGNRWKIKRDDVVLLINSEGGGSNTASMITELGVKAVITMDKISDPAEEIFKDMMIPLIPAKRVEINYMDEFAIISSETLNYEIDKWIKRVKSQKKKEDKKKLLKLVDEYRAQRRRSADK